MNTVQRNGERISKELRDTITLRYKRITKAINSEFWGSDSDTAHSRYVGSYGRGTAIDTSDIDILVELPRYEYERFDAHKGNGQSRLLQVVKAAIQTTYPRSNIRADGQVIVVDFSDGIKFEVLPAFKQIDWLGYWNGKYDYPDTNMGGNWRSTNPKAEQDAMRERNRESNGLLFHGDEQPMTVEAVLVAAADAVSAARPGARRESLETYLKRLSRLEEIAESFTGVERCFAIQAGREIRVMVKPDKVDDVEAVALAHDIVKKIEAELEYPGQIKATIIRETRVVDYAK